MNVSVVRGSSVAALVLAAALQCACSGRAPAAEGPAAPASASAATALPSAQAWRFVKLVALGEVRGRAWASIAEFDLLDVNGAPLPRSGWVATASSAGEHDGAALAIDGDPRSLWHSAWQAEPAPRPPHEFIVQLPAPVRLTGFRLLPRQDGVDNGTIAQYRLLASSDGVTWSAPLAQGTLAGGTQAGEGAAAAERTVVFARQEPNHAPVLQAPAPQTSVAGDAVGLQLAAHDADDDALTFAATGLPPGLGLAPRSGRISGTPLTPGAYTVDVSAADAKGLAARGRFTWTVTAVPDAGAAKPAAPGEVRYVRLEQLSEAAGQPWASLAELALLDAQGRPLPREGWRASADSADASDMPRNAIDGDPATFWHTQWDGAAPPPPHSLIVDLGRAQRVRGFSALPRQDASANGLIARYRFYLSADGVHWGAPVAEGDFTAMGGARAAKTVLLQRPPH